MKLMAMAMVLVSCGVMAESNVVFRFDVKAAGTNYVFTYDMQKEMDQKRMEREEQQARDEITKTGGVVYISVSMATNGLSTMKRLVTNQDWEQTKLEYAARLFSIGCFRASLDVVKEAKGYAGPEDMDALNKLEEEIKAAAIARALVYSRRKK